jgi:peptide/nickel transport system substrate-binding protein
MLIGLVLALAVSLAACGGAGSSSPSTKGETNASGTPKKGGILKVATIGNPPTLDVHTSTTTIVEQTTFNLFETLFALDAKFVPQPMLADSYSWEDGNKRLVIKLRQGVLFHNDKEMTAEDAAASIERWLKLSALGKTLLPSVSAVKAADKYTMVMELKQPVGTLIAALANPNNMPAIFPKEIVTGAGDNLIPPEKIIGTGPYKLAEYAQDRYVRLVRWDKYKPRTEPASGYAGKKEAILDEIQFIPVPEAQTRVAGLQTGEYQFAFQIPQDQFQMLKSNPQLEMVINKPTGWSTLVFNKKKGLFTDVRLRRAVNYAIDPGPAMRAGFGDPAFLRFDSSISPPETPWFGQFDNGQYNKRDLEKARALMKEAGYDGTPIRLVTTKEYEYMYKYTVVVKQQLEEAGFKVDMQVNDWATLVQRRANPDQYDIFTTGIIFSPLPTAHNVFVSDKWPGWWENPKVQEALNQFNQEVDQAKQKAAWDRVQQLFWEDIPVIKLGEYFNLNVMRTELKNFQTAPNTFFWNTSLQ